MQLVNSTVTHYAAAREGELVSEGFAAVGVAKQHVAWMNEQMQLVSLTPDVDLVAVEVKMTVSRPKLYKDAEAEQSVPEPVIEQPPAAPAPPAEPTKAAASTQPAE